MVMNVRPELVVFSVDEPFNVYRMAHFYHAVDVLRATNQLIFPVTPCIGYYDGEYEPSWLMARKDFDRHILSHRSEFVKNQQSILSIPRDLKQPVFLEWFGDDHEIVAVNTLGPMQEITAEEAKSKDAWTMILKTKTYWCAEEKAPIEILRRDPELTSPYGDNNHPI